MITIDISQTITFDISQMITLNYIPNSCITRSNLKFKRNFNLQTTNSLHLDCLLDDQSWKKNHNIVSETHHVPRQDIQERWSYLKQISICKRHKTGWRLMHWKPIDDSMLVQICKLAETLTHQNDMPVYSICRHKQQFKWEMRSDWWAA